MKLPPQKIFGSEEIDKLIRNKALIESERSKAWERQADAEQQLATAAQADRDAYADAITDPDSNEDPGRVATEAAERVLAECNERMIALRNATHKNTADFARALAERRSEVERSVGEKQEALRGELLATLATLGHQMQRWSDLSAARSWVVAPVKGEDLREFGVRPVEVETPRSSGSRIPAHRLIAGLSKLVETPVLTTDSDLLAVASSAGLRLTDCRIEDRGPAKIRRDDGNALVHGANRRLQINDVAEHGLSKLVFVRPGNGESPGLAQTVLVATSTLERVGAPDIVRQLVPQVSARFAGQDSEATLDDQETERILQAIRDATRPSISDADRTAIAERTARIRGETDDKGTTVVV